MDQFFKNEHATHQYFLKCKDMTFFFISQKLDGIFKVKWMVLASIGMAEQVTALFVAPFCSERKGELSNERRPVARHLPTGPGVARDTCQVEKMEISFLVLLISCYVDDLPSEVYLLSLNVLL